MELEITALHLTDDGGKRFCAKGNAAIRQLDRERAGVIDRVADGHGLGTRSIAAYCEKHDAMRAYSAENGWFTVQITQP